MSLLSRFAARRAGANLATDDRPTDRPDKGEQLGTYGGPTSGVVTTATARAGQTIALINDTKLTARVIRGMREHPQVTACLGAQILPLLRASWTLECDDDDIKEQVTTLYGAIHARTIRSMARATWAGYSPNTLVWDVDPESGALTVVGIRDLDPYTCEPKVDQSGDYEGFIQNKGQSSEVIVPPLQSLWGVEGMESGNLYGRSLLTAARQPWQDQLAVGLYHLRYLERFGEPVVKVRAPDGVVDINAKAREAAEIWNHEHPTDLRELPPVKYVSMVDQGLAIGEELRHHSVVSLPSTPHVGPDGKVTGYAWDLDFLTAGAAAGGAFLEKIAALDRAIARAMLVPSLLIEGGESVGSNALGEAHRDTFTQNVEARLADYASQITEHLLDRIVDFNFGERAPRARLVFAPQTDETADRLWEVVKLLVQGKAIALDVPAIAARVGLPVVMTEDEADSAASSPYTSVGLPALVAAGIITAEEARSFIGLTGATPEAVVVDAALAADRAGNRDLARVILGLGARPDPVQLGHAHGPSCRHDDAATFAAAPADVAGMPPWKQPASFDPPAFARALTPREEGVGFLTLERELNSAEAQTIDELVELLEQSRDKVTRQVAGIMRKGGSVAEIVAALSTVNVGPTAPWVSSWLTLQRTVWGEGLASVSRELEQFADLIPGDIGRDGLALVKAYAQTSAERTLTDLSTRVQLELVDAFRSGVSPTGLMATVANLYDQQIRGENQPPRLTTRMLSSKALNASRADAIERGGIVLAGAQYSAILDKRTCDLCRRLDEQLIAISDRDFEKYTAPLHFNCRCVWVYVTAEEADFEPNWSSPPKSMVDQFGGLVFGS